MTPAQQTKLRLDVRELVNRLPVNLDSSGDLEEAIFRITEFVKQREASDRQVMWETPYPGVDKQGNATTGHCRYSMSAEDCIRFERAALLQGGVPLAELQDDDRLLLDFKIIHWAGGAN